MDLRLPDDLLARFASTPTSDALAELKNAAVHERLEAADVESLDSHEFFEDPALLTSASSTAI